MGELCTVFVGLSSGSGAISPGGRVWASRVLAEICRGLTNTVSLITGSVLGASRRGGRRSKEEADTRPEEQVDTLLYSRCNILPSS